MTDHPEAKAPDVTDPEEQARRRKEWVKKNLPSWSSPRDIGLGQTTFPDETIDWSPDNIAVKFP